MSLHRLHITGYRSVRDLEVLLGPVTVITGANGTGKSNLYQALKLVAQAESESATHAKTSARDFSASNSRFRDCFAH